MLLTAFNVPSSSPCSVEVGPISPPFLNAILLRVLVKPVNDVKDLFIGYHRSSLQSRNNKSGGMQQLQQGVLL